MSNRSLAMGPNQADLAAHRSRIHRLEPPAPLKTLDAAAGFVRERQIVMVTGQSSLPVLSEAIAGRAFHGSWMSQPEARRIYALLGQLGRLTDLYEAPLVMGKGALFAVALGPAVQRIASDEARRQAALDGLTPLASDLLQRVEAEGRLRMDATDIPTREGRAARTSLERALLVTGESLHTESGRHTAVVRDWSASPIARGFAGAAANLTLAEAESGLLLACIRSAVLAPEREVKRWFDWAGARLHHLLDKGRVRRYDNGQVAVGSSEF